VGCPPYMVLDSRRLLRNVVWGAKWGLAFGVAYAIIGSGFWIVASDSISRRYGTSFDQLVAVYLLGGVLAGTVAGLLRPLLRSRPGAMVVGVLGAVPIAWLIYHTVAGGDPQGRIASVIWAVVMGAGGGWVLWERLQ
jgi:hypothetical protein